MDDEHREQRGPSAGVMPVDGPPAEDERAPGGDDRPQGADPGAEALTARTIAALLGFIALWRFGIGLLSYLWGRMGIAEAWPPEIDVMWLWRYSVRWDAGWYLAIVEEGYQYTPGASSSIAFFPLFPLLVRGLDMVLPGSTVLTGLLVVHLALATAILYIYRLVRLDHADVIAWRTVTFLLLFPAAFFFSAFYADALLLLAFAGSLYHARRGQWLRAGLFAAGGGAAKLVGIVAAVPLLVEMIGQRALSRARLRPLAGLALAPLGFFGYIAYLQVRFGDFRILFETETQWYREAGRPVFFLGIERLLGDTSALIYYPANTAPLRSVFLLGDTTLLLLFLVAGVVLWLRVRPSYGALVVAGALVPAFSGSPQSLNRYLAVLFPAFLLMGRIRSEPVRQGLLLLSTCGLAFTVWLYVQGFWAG